MRGIVQRALGPDIERDNVVQQVLCVVLRNQEGLREPLAQRAWVRTITFNVVYDLLRRRQLRHAAQGVAAAEMRGDLVRTVEVRDLLARLKALVEGLPVSEQSAFVLRYVEGRRLAEIAAIEGYSLATARRRLARARRILRALASQAP